MTPTPRAAAALAAAIALAGCGGGGAPPEAEGDAAPAFEVAREWTWRESDGDGYDVETAFELGEFALPADAQRLPGFASFDQLGETCLLDGTADALAPVAVRMTNRGAAPASLSSRVSLGTNEKITYGVDNATELLLVTKDGDTVACGRLGSSHLGEDGSWYPGWVDVPAGAATDRAYGYLLVRDFFSVDLPPGSAELRLARSFLDVGDLDDATSLTSIDGPALAAPLAFPALRIVAAGFPLDGTRPPCGFGDMVVRCR